MSEFAEQKSAAWYEARSGHVTASRISEVLTKGKGTKESSVRKSYMAQVIFERILGKSLEQERGNFRDIKRGLELEAAAKVEYDMRTGADIESAGFVKHPRLPMAGCSPDGYVGEKGLIQVKCPRWHVQIDWVTHGVVPLEHKDQILFELACTGREWTDFVSFVDVDGLEPKLRLFISRQKRDEARIAEIEAAVAKFNTEVEETLAKLTGKELSLEDQLRESLAAVNQRKGIELVEEHL